jgi:hypothetical protein
MELNIVTGTAPAAAMAVPADVSPALEGPAAAAECNTYGCIPQMRAALYYKLAGSVTLNELLSTCSCLMMSFSSLTMAGYLLATLWSSCKSLARS